MVYLTLTSKGKFMEFMQFIIVKETSAYSIIKKHSNFKIKTVKSFP